MEPLTQGAVRFRQPGDLREHLALPIRLLARPTARGHLLLLDAVLHRGPFLVRESLEPLFGRGGALGGLLRVLHLEVSSPVSIDGTDPHARVPAAAAASRNLLDRTARLVLKGAGRRRQQHQPLRGDSGTAAAVIAGEPFKAVRRGGGQSFAPAAWATATRFGTTMRQASSTRSRISASSSAAMRASTQLKRSSDGPGSMNFSGEPPISQTRSSLGNANPMTVSSREKASHTI